ncbi:MAG: helix-turn-helix domain-containing protein [Clostridiales bacterium]
MRLNMHMIADNLPCNNMEMRFSQRAKISNLLQAKIYGSYLELGERYLYLLDAKEYKGTLPPNMNLSLVILGDVDMDTFPNNYEIIIVKDHIPLLELFDILQQCFEWYNTWQESLNTILNDDADIGKMCDVSKSIFKNPIVVHDGNFESIAYNCSEKVLNDTLWQYSDKIGTYIASETLINCFKMEKLYEETMEKTTVENYHAPHLAFDVLYVNLTGTEKFPGRIVVAEYYEKNPFSLYEPLEFLGKMISAAIGRRKALAHGSHRSMEKLIGDILSGTMVDIGYADFCLHSRNWQLNDSYYCIIIRLNEGDIKSNSVFYSCQKLEEIVGDAFALFYENSLFCVCHVADDKPQAITIGTELGAFLREGFYKAGISNVYHNILETNTYHYQAQAALNIGNKIDPDIWYYFFNAYAMPHLIYHGIGNMPPELFCDDNILGLKDLGGKDGVDYFNTLKVYLKNNMNLLHSAEALFIHRTTLFYRLNRIKDFINVDLNDENVRLRLLISYYILELTDK